MKLSNLFKYYNSCYQEDTSGAKINDFLSNNIENKFFFEKEELINGLLPYYPLEKQYANKTSKKVIISSNEKELVYCTLFMAGKDNKNFSKNTVFLTPLIIYPAKLVKIDDDFFVQIDKENRSINFDVFTDFFDNSNQLEVFYEEFYKIVNQEVIDNTVILNLIKLFEKYSLNIYTSELLAYPELVDRSKIEILIKQHNDLSKTDLIAIPASAIAIANKSVNTRGIVNELNFLSSTNDYSKPIQAIFSKKTFETQSDKNKGFTPAVLNKKQQKIIDTSEQYPFSVIIGPPGTGKSYTISALSLEKISKGKSVLITASTDKAVDVIAEKIEKNLKLKNIIVRGGRRNYKKELLNYLQKIYTTDIDLSDITPSKNIQKLIKQTERKLIKVEKLFQTRIEEELKWGKYIAENRLKKSFFVNLKRKYIQFRNKKAENHWQVEEEMQELLNKKNDLTIEYISSIYQENLFDILNNHKKSIDLLAKALRSNNGVKQTEYFQQLDFNIVFKIFPIWLVKMSDLYKTLPFKTEIFDFVIIDEATQCNIAQAVPVLQRGKHAIITGDFKQLRHFSFLSQTKQNIFKSKYKVNDFDDYITNYKKNSVLDIISKSTQYVNQFTSLDEHFRSLPAIISFSNKNYYDDKLKIMTSRPDLEENLGVEITECNGARNNKGVNQIEADFVLKKIKEIVENEKHLDSKICSSIGVLSPFRDQTEYLKKNITNDLKYSQISKHNISVNTAYGFQGDEKDIMLISFALDNNSHHSAFRYLNKEDVFNVSITRARKMQFVFHSLQIEKIKFNNILRRYLESFSPNISYNDEFNIKDEFLNDVKLTFKNNNFKVWQAYNVAGLTIDLIIKKNEKIIGIDLIGFPGQFEKAFTAERYKMLHRAGLDTFPLPYTYWVSEKEKCFTEIENIIKN